MEFESPDVAKEFPGLYNNEEISGIGGTGGGRVVVAGLGGTSKKKSTSMNDPNEYDEDSDKSFKKKKDKKDSKKDKGYAALAGESSPDEDDHHGSKSPGRVKKLKGFKLTSSKKHKDKEVKVPVVATVEASAAACCKTPFGTSAAMAVVGGAEPSKKDKKMASTATEKELKKERKLSSDGKVFKSDKALLGLVTRKHSIPSSSAAAVVVASSSGSTLPGPSTSTKDSSAPSSSSSTSSRQGGQRHPLPFSPTAAAKDQSQHHHHTKKELIDEVKVRLKLKRGGSSNKNSMEETQNPPGHRGSSSSGSAGGDPPPQGVHELPEDPESLAKEIKKYEALLEQSHSQIKASKKVSKKHEEQLWELQRTLTQLKRKLRSINALSCASIITNTSTILNPTPAAAATTAPAPILHHAELSSVERQVPQVAVASINTVTVTGLATAAGPSDTTRSSASTSSTVSVKLPPPPPPAGGEFIPESVLELERPVPAPVAAPVALAPVTAFAPSRTETVQVYVQVHKNRSTTDKESKEPSTSTVFIEPPPPSSKAKTHQLSRLEKSSSNSLELVPDPPSTSSTVYLPHQYQTQSPETCAGVGAGAGPVPVPRRIIRNSESSPPTDTDNTFTDEVDGVDCGDYVEISYEKRHSLPLNHKPIFSAGVLAASARSSKSPPFDPFALPMFQTDEFIALENEALIMFNQALQDQIIEEEALVENLAKKLGTIIDENNHGLLYGVSLEELDELENDELVSTLETVKHENDRLNDQVASLRVLVAKAKLEEFQLELRLKYIQDHEQLDELEQEEEEEDSLSGA